MYVQMYLSLHGWKTSPFEKECTAMCRFYRWKLWFQYKWRIILWNTNGKLVGDGKNDVWKTGKILQRFYNMYMHIFKQDSFVIIEIFHFFFSQHWLFINKCKHFDHIEQQHITFNSPPIFHQPLPESHVNSSKFYRNWKYYSK